MKRLFGNLLVASLLAGALAGTPLLCAADASAKTPEKAATPTKASVEKGKAKRDWYPFYGYVASVDPRAGTVSLKKKQGERVLKTDAQTQLEVGGKPAVLGSVKVGDYAHGKLRKDGAGKEVIVAAKFDKEAPVKKQPAAEKEPQKAPAAKSKE